MEGTAVLPRDLSPWGMFMNADVVVKAVMIGLVIASVVTWTVWLAKTIEISEGASAGSSRTSCAEFHSNTSERPTVDGQRTSRGFLRGSDCRIALVRCGRRTKTA